MITVHHCWWTQNRLSELTNHGDAITGAGCPTAVLEFAAGLLSTELQRAPSQADAYGEEISIGSLASGASHDGCFFQLRPLSAPLRRAVLSGTLELHASYLGTQVDWSGVVDGLAAHLAPGMSLRIRTILRQQRLAIQAYPLGTGALRRWLTRSMYVDCTGVKAVLL
jgi:hypothetical protein